MQNFSSLPSFTSTSFWMPLVLQSWYCPLKLRYLKGGLLTSSVGSTRELVRNQESQTSLQPYWFRICWFTRHQVIFGKLWSPTSADSESLLSARMENVPPPPTGKARHSPTSKIAKDTGTVAQPCQAMLPGAKLSREEIWSHVFTAGVRSQIE